MIAAVRDTPKIGGGQPHSKTLGVFGRSGARASVFECGCPLPPSYRLSVPAITTAQTREFRFIVGSSVLSLTPNFSWVSAHAVEHQPFQRFSLLCRYFWTVVLGALPDPVTTPVTPWPPRDLASPRDADKPSSIYDLIIDPRLRTAAK
jgi:hypothetical protein